MFIKLNSLRDRGWAAPLLRDLRSFGEELAAIQDTHFVCYVDASVLSNYFVVYSAYGRSEVILC